MNQHVVKGFDKLSPNGLNKSAFPKVSSKHELPSSSDPEIQQIKILAENGNAGAQGLVGFMYLYGEGAPQDNAQALMWSRSRGCYGAMERGHHVRQG